MSYISNFTDRISKTQLASKDDIAMLNVTAEAAAYPEREARKIEEMESLIKDEAAKKYPNKEYIANCEKTILKIKRNVALYKMQRQK